MYSPPHPFVTQPTMSIRHLSFPVSYPVPSPSHTAKFQHKRAAWLAGLAKHTELSKATLTESVPGLPKACRKSGLTKACTESHA